MSFILPEDFNMCLYNKNGSFNRKLKRETIQELIDNHIIEPNPDLLPGVIQLRRTNTHEIVSSNITMVISN